MFGKFFFHLRKGLIWLTNERGLMCVFLSRKLFEFVGKQALSCVEAGLQRWRLSNVQVMFDLRIWLETLSRSGNFGTETKFCTLFDRLSIISRLTKLKFLDARPVDNLERLSAMQVTNLQNNHQSPQSTTEARMEKFGSIKKFFGFTRRPTKVADEPSTELLNTYSPLPDDNFDSTQSTPKSFYGKVKSHYEGTQSQGNRFILNQDLWKEKC